ncbi:MAG TPA: PadR family transcriptional regulator [Gemmatimonadaceae bacterium]|nr:PadR family transcriptional regulator [Gemmatimonadaceae bacterium]
MAADLDLLRGTLDLFVLKTLTWGPMHGLGIVRWIERVSKDGLQVEEGALYPALHRMEQRGWIEGEWGATEQGRRARFYRLTAAGRRAYAAQLETWNRYTSVAQRILSARGAVT